MFDTVATHPHIPIDLTEVAMPPKKAAAAAAAADLDDSTLSLAADETKASTTKGKSAAKKDDDGLGIEVKRRSLPKQVLQEKEVTDNVEFVW